jgi:NAD-dependent DNA ligase
MKGQLLGKGREADYYHRKAPELVDKEYDELVTSMWTNCWAR